MKVERFLLGPVGTNCYISVNEETKACFIVDPAACPPEFTGYLKNKEYKVEAVFLTHGHFDHIMGLDELLKEYPVPVYAYEAERQLLESAQLNASLSMYGRSYTFSGAQYVTDGQMISAAETSAEVIFTPGHTAGGCCYYLADEGILFSGDTLFCTSIGRTDLPTGSGSQLIRSIRERLFILPDETKVYPGHMDETTIGYEKKYNPFL